MQWVSFPGWVNASAFRVGVDTAVRLGDRKGILHIKILGHLYPKSQTYLLGQG